MLLFRLLYQTKYRFTARILGCTTLSYVYSISLDERNFIPYRSAFFYYYCCYIVADSPVETETNFAL